MGMESTRLHVLHAQMEKQLLEKTLQQVLETSPPPSEQQDVSAQTSSDNKPAEDSQVGTHQFSPYDTCLATMSSRAHRGVTAEHGIFLRTKMLWGTCPRQHRDSMEEAALYCFLVDGSFLTEVTCRAAQEMPG